MDKWISVKDRLPKYKKMVILFCPGYSGRPILEGSLYDTNENGNNWVDGVGFARSGVTHWMPLPEPPQDGE